MRLSADNGWSIKLIPAKHIFILFNFEQPHNVAPDNLGLLPPLHRKGYDMPRDEKLIRALLADLKKAYQSLPRHVQVRVTTLLRESAPQELPAIERAG